VFDPENFFDFQIKVPAYPFTKTFGASCFKDALAGLGGYNDIGPEVLHIQPVYGKIYDP
jgi:hypothetical protein